MDAATAARMSDPQLNRHFRRRWHDQKLPTSPSTRQTPEPSADAPNDRLARLADLLRAEWRRQREAAGGGGS